MSLLDAVGWALLHFVWQATIVAALAALVLTALRRASATARYAVSVLALFTMGLLPIVTAWRHVSSSPPAAPAPIVSAASDAAAAAPRPAARSAAAPDLGKASRRVFVAPAPAAHGGPRAPEQAARARVAPLLPWIVAAWALGVVLLSLRLIGGWLRARRLAAIGVVAAPEACRAAAARLAARLGVRAAVRVLESRLIDVPLALGWLRPVILLPTSAFSGLTVEQLDAILAHELAHIRRQDYFVNLAQSVVETVLFYHPAVWWVSRQVRQEREHCCDDLAVAACGDRAGYARALVGMERLRTPAMVAGVSMTGGSLVMRIKRLVTPEIAHADSSPRWAASILALAAALTVGAVTRAPAAVATGPFDRERVENPPLPTVDQPAAGESPTVVRLPDPTGALEARWAAAERTASAQRWTRYWVGYAVPRAASLHGLFYSDRHVTIIGDRISLSGTMTGDFESFRFPGSRIDTLVGGGESSRIKVLLSVGAGAGGGARPALLRTHASTFALPVDLAGQPVVWLGDAEARSSVPLLARFFDAASDPKLAEDLVTLIGLHDDAAVVTPALVRILNGSAPADVRAQAAERLAWHPVAASLTALTNAARRDRSTEVRREAAESVGELAMPEAAPALIDLARTLSDRDARLEAVEALGERREPEARVALVDLVNTDTDLEVQREAVETLGDLRDHAGRASVIEVARTHQRAEIRREAIETVASAMSAGEAVTFLTQTARDDKDREVQREAVETLGDIEDPRAIAALMELARSHPQRDVRREAIETLGEATPSPAIVDLLAGVVRDASAGELRLEAIETLGELADGAGLTRVTEFALSHPTPEVRGEAVETLAEHAPAETALDVLRRVVATDTDEQVRDEAIESLEDLQNGAGIPALIDLARSHPNADVRADALKRLVESDDPRARAIFERALARP